MVPGAFATKATLALFALTAQEAAAASNELTVAIQNSLRVVFITAALGAGLATPTFLFRGRAMKRTR